MLARLANTSKSTEGIIVIPARAFTGDRPFGSKIDYSFTPFFVSYFTDLK